MGTVFRKSWTAPLPPGAEIVEQRGKRIARYRIRSGKLRTAEVFTAADGRVRMRGTTKSYIAKFRDAAGYWIERPTGCSDETAARAVLAQLERRAELVKAGVKAILNYAPINLAVPATVRVQYLDPVTHLQRMT